MAFLGVHRSVHRSSLIPWFSIYFTDVVWFGIFPTFSWRRIIFLWSLFISIIFLLKRLKELYTCSTISGDFVWFAWIFYKLLYMLRVAPPHTKGRARLWGRHCARKMCVARGKARGRDDKDLQFRGVFGVSLKWFRNIIRHCPNWSEITPTIVKHIVKFLPASIGGVLDGMFEL